MTRTTNVRRVHVPLLHRSRLNRNGPGQQGGQREETAAKLASIAQHAADVRVAIVLELLGCICALVLAVMLFRARTA